MARVAAELAEIQPLAGAQRAPGLPRDRPRGPLEHHPRGCRRRPELAHIAARTPRKRRDHNDDHGGQPRHQRQPSGAATPPMACCRWCGNGRRAHCVSGPIERLPLDDIIDGNPVGVLKQKLIKSGHGAVLISEIVRRFLVVARESFSGTRASPMKPLAHCRARNRQRLRDLGGREPSPGMEQQHLALIRRERLKRGPERWDERSGIEPILDIGC